MSSDTIEAGSKIARVRMTRFVVPHPAFRWLLLRICLASLGTLAFLGGCLALYHGQVGAPMPIPLTAVLLVSGVAGVGTSAAFLVHRVTGPLFRMQREMSRVIDGHRVEGMRIRKDDQLRELCEVYNQMLYRLDVIEPKPE
jgi:hypothetical protein